MNKKAIIIGLVVIFITTAFCGCLMSEEEAVSYLIEEPGDDYGVTIIVIVRPSVTVKKYDDVHGYVPASNEAVLFTVSMTDGLLYTSALVTNEGGYIKCSPFTFDLEPGRIITSKTTVSGVSDTVTLTYETAYAHKTDDERYTWAPWKTMYI